MMEDNPMRQVVIFFLAVIAVLGLTLSLFQFMAVNDANERNAELEQSLNETEAQLSVAHGELERYRDENKNLTNMLCNRILFGNLMAERVIQIEGAFFMDTSTTENSVETNNQLYDKYCENYDSPLD